MDTVAGAFRKSVADAIRVQVAPRRATRGPRDDIAIDALAAALVDRALLDGRFGHLSVAEPRPFSAGNTALLVGSLTASLEYVVKADTNRKVVAEARLLQRLMTDLSLPETTRKAFPDIYAVSDAGPLFGYLMENLEGYTPLHETLAGSPQDVAHVLGVLWRTVLLPAYSETGTSRLPSIVDDYVGRVEARLDAAATARLIPAPEMPLRIEAHGAEPIEVHGGWGSLLARARERVTELAPAFGTFVHGDPNPENVLWRGEPGGDCVVRLIDPKEWWTGDYIFDVANVGHYLRVTGPVEQLEPQAVCEAAAGITRLSWDAKGLRIHADVEQTLLSHVASFAEDTADGPPRDPTWRERYEFAVASNLLGIVLARVKRGEKEPTQRHLAWIALGEGLRLLHDGVAR